LEVRTATVKCPRCGFVSYAGQPQCKKCGHAFVRTTRESESSSSVSPSNRSDSRPSPVKPQEAPTASIGDVELRNSNEASPAAPPASPILADSSSQNPLQAESPAQKWLGVERPIVPETTRAATASNWREELSTRVQDYRRRRAKLQRETDAPQNLDLDFDSQDLSEQPVLVDDDTDSSGKPAADLEWGLDDPSPAPSAPAVTLETVEKVEAEPAGDDAVAEEPAEFPSATRETVPIDIVVDLPETVEPVEEEIPTTAFLAPVGRRFLAGLTDATVLVLSAGLFGVIFWRSGGHLSPDALNFAVLGVVATILVFSYFALFCMLTSTTPGLLWSGCEIRNLEGECPDTRESCWRAFGILVSLSALLLGFIWALVDSESLTWHDRMSGTFVTLAPLEPEAPQTEGNVDTEGSVAL